MGRRENFERHRCRRADSSVRQRGRARGLGPRARLGRAHGRARRKRRRQDHASACPGIGAAAARRPAADRRPRCLSGAAAAAALPRLRRACAWPVPRALGGREPGVLLRPAGRKSLACGRGAGDGRTESGRAPPCRPAFPGHATAAGHRPRDPPRTQVADPRRARRQPWRRRVRSAERRHARHDRGAGDPRSGAGQQAVPPHHRASSRALPGHGDTPSGRAVNQLRVALAVARKDLRSEWRTRELVPALAQFIILALLIGNFGFQIDSRNATTIAPGILWLALVFAGLVAFGRTFAAEREQASLEAMLMTPASPVAIFAGKALAAGALLVVCEMVLLPALSLFFGMPLSGDVVAAVLLATVGMAALGCLFAAVVARVRARELLLPLLTLPLWIPFIIAGGMAVQSAMGLPGSYQQAIGLLIDFDILFVVLTSLAARFVLDE